MTSLAFGQTKSGIKALNMANNAAQLPGFTR